MDRRRNRALVMPIVVLVAARLCASLPNVFDMSDDATQTAQIATYYAFRDTKEAATETAAASGTQSVMGLFLTNTPHTRRPPTKTFTPTPSPAIVRVDTQTNCRTGPSIAYDIVTAFQVGQTAPVVGKNTPMHYWVIKLPGGGTCWLWDQYVTVTGNTRTLPEMKPPPIPTLTKSPPLVPIRPSNTPYSP